MVPVPRFGCEIALEGILVTFEGYVWVGGCVCVWWFGVGGCGWVVVVVTWFRVAGCGVGGYSRDCKGARSPQVKKKRKERK